MDVTVKHGSSGKDIKIGIGELVDIRRSVFKVCTLQADPIVITLQPANESQVKEYFKKSEPKPEPKIEASPYPIDDPATATPKKPGGRRRVKK